MSLEKVCQAIKKNKKFLITAHYEPEGDSIGSQLAMAGLLKQLNKKYIIVNVDLPPERYEFLRNIGQIGLSSLETYDFDIALVLDCPILERIGNVNKIIRNKPIINIDHHVSNRYFGTINYVQKNASSTGEILYSLVEKLGCKLNRDLATYLYLAILTDTGGFVYSNTTPKAMRIAANLLEFGLNPKELYERIYESHSLASRKLLGMCLNTLKISPDGQIVWMYLTKDMFKRTKAATHDAENFINYARFVNGVKMAMLFSDAPKKGFIKVSFRSNQLDIDVNKFAAKFGGGGHVSASGCLVRGTLTAVQKKILKKAKEFIG